ncbi:MAG: OFA family MFS transporter [Desulfobulbus sp.]|uniref:L-lactate MFS transporter n=1 Tax=Desulfobulbus sp. TaxID=895 RepID=UPI0028426694|nr:OFA family MFS transporter [Desulfobulbus sp.]MDR2551300.1 OFA family MFS transporter [Desulfobulbus sp.]
MSEQTTFPRWIPLLGGLLGSTTCGLLLYAFSKLIKPLMAEFGWAQTEVAFAYAIICFVFGLMTFPGGKLSDKIGPRNVVFFGGLVLALGFFLVSTLSPPDKAILAAGGEAAIAAKEAAKTQLYLFYLYYGVLAGFGGAFVYLPPIAVASKWWPDKKAMATGFTVVGLGIGSFIMVPIADKIIAANNGSALPVFYYVGIAMAVLVVLAALCMKNPPAGYKPAGWNPPVPAAGGPKAFRDYTYEEAKKTPQFWLLWLVYFCGSFAGLMVIGLLAKFGGDAGNTNPGLAVQCLAVANAAVRILIGPIVDKLGGTKKVFIILFSLQAIAMVALYPSGSSTLLLSVTAALIGWNYGAMFTLFPATTLNYFGITSQGSNYGLLFTAWGVAGLFGPTCGSKLQEITKSFMTPFIASAVILAIAVIILATLKAPEKKHA